MLDWDGNLYRGRTDRFSRFTISHVVVRDPRVNYYGTVKTLGSTRDAQENRGQGDVTLSLP